MSAEEAGSGSGRLSYTEVMERTIQEMGDIDEFVDAQDLIVLRLDAPLPAKSRIPSPLAVSADRTRLTTNCDGLTRCQRFLAKHRYPSVLLAGLPKLGSVPSFLAAAREVLYGTQTLMIVHNRDRILDLAGWFRCPTYMLYHDLHLQPDYGGLPFPDITRFQHVVAVYGTTPALGCDQLYLSTTNILSLLENTHKLSKLQAPMQDIVFLVSGTPYGLFASQPLLFRQCEEMTLGCHLHSRWGGAKTIGFPASVAVVKGALELCPQLQRLQVTTDSKEVLALIARFSRLVRLSVMYVSKEHRLPFDPNMTHLLQSLPSLTHLALTHFKRVSLSFIDKTCRNLESLTLTGSEVVNESFNPFAFPNLTSLTLDWFVNEHTFNSFLLCTAQTVTDLRIEGDIGCAKFVTSACRVPFRCLKRLTLKTDKSLLAMDARPEALCALFDRMPMLERLTTDCYDIRLFAQCHHPRVKLDWTQCTVCSAEFPRVNAPQEKIWREVHARE